MPFGLCNAPATFQRLMHKVLGELIYSCAPVYIDDINIHSKTFEEHLIDIRNVLEKIRKSGMKLRREKCEFAKRELEFLGHIVGQDGIKMDPKKIEIFEKYPKPKTVQDVQAFLGGIGYYRKFIKNFSKIAKPLSDLTKGHTRKFQNKKDITEEWTEKHEKAFMKLKKKMMKKPVMQYPDFRKRFIVSTDASNYAIGAVLLQEDEKGREYVISNISRKLKSAECNYSVTEKECLAIIFALEKFHHYIWQNEFIIKTDHRPLQWLYKQEMKGRIARWIEKITLYNFEIVYKEGKKHQNADFLSRINWQDEKTYG
jgi:hypothetical protein